MRYHTQPDVFLIKVVFASPLLIYLALFILNTVSLKLCEKQWLLWKCSYLDDKT
jgi:hypothetical protein